MPVLVILTTSTVSPGRLELSFMYVQWGESVPLFPGVEARQLIALQALLRLLQPRRHRPTLQRLVQDEEKAGVPTPVAVLARVTRWRWRGWRSLARRCHSGGLRV